ncbi:MAG: cation-transporting P-type ATPase [Microbacterium sp.]
MSAPAVDARLSVDRPFSVSVVEVAGALGTGDDGLSPAEAADRLALVGPNLLPEPKRTPAWLRFLSHFNDTLIYILLGAAAIKAVMGDWLDFWVIMAVAVINAVIGYVQEGRAEKALAGIRGMLSADATVRRGGTWATIPAAELVPGDLVRLMPGDKVPADVRLVEASQLRIDEAALTGESVPSSKHTDAVDAGAGVGDRASMAFSGTIVSAGQSRGIVTATGRAPRSAASRLSSARRAASRRRWPERLDSFGKVLTIVILGMATVMMLIGHTCTTCPCRARLGDDQHRRWRRSPRASPAARDDPPSPIDDAADGAAQRHHPQAPRRRGARVGHDRLRRQDRHPDEERDDRAHHGHRGRSATRSRGSATTLRVRSPRPSAATCRPSWPSPTSATTRTSTG